jgi:hypothetical protein
MLNWTPGATPTQSQMQVRFADASEAAAGITPLGLLEMVASESGEKLSDFIAFSGERDCDPFWLGGNGSSVDMEM